MGDKLVSIREGISMIDLARAGDEKNVTEQGMRAVGDAIHTATTKAGFKRECSPFPAIHQIEDYKREINRKFEKWNLQAYTNPQHPGWHMPNALQTLQLMALNEDMVCTANSVKDVMYVAQTTDGASMAGAMNRCIVFGNLECVNKLKARRWPKKVKSEHAQYMVAAAELDDENAENIESMFSWAVEEVNAYEAGLTTLKPETDKLKVACRQQTSQLQQAENTLKAAKLRAATAIAAGNEDAAAQV
jgi:hypothetical protein